MAEGSINVGQVHVSVVPDARGWDARMDREITPQAKALGERVGAQLGRDFAARITPSVRDAIAAASGPARAQGLKTGEEFGGSFATTARTRIDAAFRALPKAKVGTDATELDAELETIRARLAALSDVRIGVDLAASEALAETERLRVRLAELSGSSPDVQVRVDAGRAAAELAVIQAEVDRLDGRDAKVDVRVDDHGGLGQLAASAEGAAGGMSGLVSTALALSPALIPVGAAAAVGLGGIATAAAAGAAGVGVLVLGFSGVLDAVKAIGAAQAAAGADAARSAQQQVAAAAQIANAEDAVRNAHRGVQDAARSAAAGVASALLAEGAAEQAYAAAQRTARQATLDLTAAREDAKRALEDLAQQVADGALAQRQADLAVKQARQDLNKVLADPMATQLQRQQAQLAYDEAVQQVADVTLRNQRLAAQKAAADKAGIDGSQQVVAAQGQVASTARAVVDAQAAQGRAAAAVAEAHRAGAERVKVAQEQVVSAQRALNTALATTGPTASAASKKAAEALAGLTPAGRAFTLFLTGELLPKLTTIRAAAQTGLLPGVEAGLKALEPILPAIAGFVGGLATVMGDLFREAGQALASPFWRSFGDYVKTTAGPALRIFAGILGNVATGFAGLMEAFAPSSAALGTGLLGLTGRFAAFGQSLQTNKGFQTFLAYVRDNTPVVVRVLGDIFTIVGRLVGALAPFGAVLLQAAAAVGDLLTQLDPGVLLAIGGALAVAFGGPVLVVTALAAAAYYAYTQFQPLHDFIDTKVLPVLTALAGYITGTVVPILKHIAEDALAGLVAAFHTVSQAVADHRGELTSLVNAFKAVAAFIIERILPLLGPVLKGAFQLLGTTIAVLITDISAIVDAFVGVKNAATTSATWVSDKFDALVGFFSQLPDRITTAASGMFDGIKVAFADALNFVIGKWNDLEFSIGIPKSAFGIPIPGGGHSIDIGTPNIDKIQARALGGNVAADAAYLVGERGPELFFPGRSGYVASHADSMAALLAATSQDLARNSLGSSGAKAPTVIEHFEQHNHHPAQAYTDPREAMMRLQWELSG